MTYQLIIDGVGEDSFGTFDEMMTAALVLRGSHLDKHFTYKIDHIGKGAIVRYKRPMADEIGTTFLLLEEPDGGRVLAEALVNLPIRPTLILQVSEIEVTP